MRILDDARIAITENNYALWHESEQKRKHGMKRQTLQEKIQMRDEKEMLMSVDAQICNAEDASMLHAAVTANM